MDGIAPYRGNSATTPALSAQAGGGAVANLQRPAHLGFAAPHAPDPSAVKTPAHYLGAARRRIWLILAVAVPLSIVFSILALRQPRIYRASAEVAIEPPRLDPTLSQLVSRDLGRGDPSAQEKYAPNMVARLTGRALADRVVKQARLGFPANRQTPVDGGPGRDQRLGRRRQVDRRSPGTAPRRPSRAARTPCPGGRTTRPAGSGARLSAPPRHEAKAASR